MIQNSFIFSDYGAATDQAEKDLESRGSGEIYGARQSGLPEFKIASIADSELVSLAQKEAKRAGRRLGVGERGALAHLVAVAGAVVVVAFDQLETEAFGQRRTQL